ncbi:Elongator subunit elp6, partial [Tieghemiomyces parasiticus]
MGFAALDPHLPPHHQPGLPERATVLITDTLASDGGFLLHHFVTSALAPTSRSAKAGPRPTTATSAVPTIAAAGVTQQLADGLRLHSPEATVPEARVILVGLAQIYNHYFLIARKLGLNLTTFRDQGRFVFIDGVSRLSPYARLRSHEAGTGPVSTTAAHILPPLSQPAQTYLDELLRVLVGYLDGPVDVSALPSSGSPPPASSPPPPPSPAVQPCLILDDLSVLWNLGLDGPAIVRFAHACKIAVEARGGVLVVVVPADPCLRGQRQ